MLDEHRQGHDYSPFPDSTLSRNEVDEPEHDDDGLSDENTHDDEFTKRQAYFLYISHSLSMWNSRMYEYGVVKRLNHDTIHNHRCVNERHNQIIFIQTAFSGNLLASSINGIAETVCVLFFSSALGRWVNRAPRLPALLQTITFNRVAVLVSCVTWFAILSLERDVYKKVWFAIALLLGMIEKLSRITNTLSMERDWVPLLANPCLDRTQPVPYSLTHLNTVMRRIDMLCKLIAPLFISTLTTSLKTETIVVALVATINTLSWTVECWCLRKVWKESNRLKAPKVWVDDSDSGRLEPTSQIHSDSNTDAKDRATTPTAKPLSRFYTYIQRTVGADIEGLQYYLSSPVWIPALCAAVMHASVLSYSGTLITYLLNSGFSLNVVTVARFTGACFEIGSTFAYPWVVRVLSKGNLDTLRYELAPQNASSDSSLAGRNPEEDQKSGLDHEPSNSELGVVRAGVWGIFTLCLSLIPTVIALFFLGSQDFSENASPYPLSAFILCLSISISLFGRWTYDLSATQLTQTLIPATHRSSFGGTEMSIVSVLSLGHWIAAAVWHTQNDFKWLAVGSLVLVGLAAGAYYRWAKRWRSESGIRVVVDGSGEIE
ncbi:MAG: hypothetical protein Q9191_004372 [Dirinaria sp. TL-2023a]